LASKFGEKLHKPFFVHKTWILGIYNPYGANIAP
jgi:hypothetical protein